MRLSRRLVLFSTVALAVVAVACGSDDSSDDGGAASGGTQKEDIVIGLPIGLTGGYSAFDVPIYAGSKISAEDINAKGGVNGAKLKLVAKDTASSLTKAPAVAQQVIEEGAKIVVPTADYDFGGPAARVATGRGLLVVATAGDPLFGKQGIGPLAFSDFPPSPTEAAVMAQFAINKGWKRAYVFADTSIQYSKRGCQYTVDAYKHLGGTIAGTDTFVNTDASIGPQVTRMNAAKGNADVVFLCSYVPGVTGAVKQIRAGGVDLPIVGQIGADGRAITGGVPDLSDFYWPSLGLLFGEESENKEITRLGDLYKKQGGDEKVADWTVISGYAKMQVIAAAIKKANGSTTGTDLQKAMESFKDEPVIWGGVTYSADCHGPVKPSLKIAAATDGKLSILPEKVTPTYVPPYPCNGQ
jgi:branched-chain amino acid transport system substrate-binding protein